MKLKVFVYLLILFVLTGCAGQPPKNSLQESMVRLDEKYIPALFFTRLHRVRESEIALESLRKTWNDFHLKFYNLKMTYGVNIVDKFWQSDFDRLDRLITSAEGFARSREFDRAHQSLADVREVFYNLRERNGIEYFLDGMNRFDRKLEELQQMLRGKTYFTERQMKQLQAFYEETQASWNSLTILTLKPGDFGFSEEKITAVKKRINIQQEALDGFKEAIDAGEPDEIFQAAQELKPNFIVLYKAFGDFQPIFDAIIKERDSEDRRGSQKEKKEK